MSSTYTLKIHALSSNGEGIGSLDGLKVFVDGALPDETVTVRIREQKKNYAIADLVEVISPSQHRVEPPCPLFGSCGGCQLMHLDYSQQLIVKRQRVVDALTRLGHFHDLPVLPCLPSPHSLAYRNKIQLPLIWEKGKKTIGLYRKESHEIIPLNQCLIQCAEGEAILKLIRERLEVPSVRFTLIRNAVFNQEALLIFVTDGGFSKELQACAESLMAAHPTLKGVVENVNLRSDNVILGNHFRLLAGRAHIFEKLLGKTFKISPAAFFQVNPAQTERLYALAIDWAALSPEDIVLDAYCGVGALALFAADSAKEVYGTEMVPSAISDAIENQRLNHQTGCHFICGKAEELIHRFSRLDLVFLNPPRKGCDPSMIHSLLTKKPSKIIYISCDPATLARDLAGLSPTYQIEKVQPVDMFPQTMHVETVVKLVIR